MGLQAQNRDLAQRLAELKTENERNILKVDPNLPKPN